MNEINTDEVIALGCGIQSNLLSKQVNDLTIRKFVPVSLGLEVENGIFDVVIDCLKKIPCS